MSDVLFDLRVNPAGADRQAAADCEAAVFLEAYGNTAEELAEEYGPYDDASVFVSLARDDVGVVAACRLILPGPAGLKTLNDTSREPWHVDGYRSARAAGIDASLTIDIATIGVLRGFRGIGTLAAISLYHSIVMVSRMNAMPFVVMIMDARARRLLSATGCETHVLPGTTTGPYLGSAESTPLWANVVSMLDRQRVVNPDAHRLISQGAGLDGIRVPPPESFKLPNQLLTATR